MTENDFIDKCYRIKGEIIECTTLVEYQLTYIISLDRIGNDQSTLNTIFHKIKRKTDLKEKIALTHSIITKNNPQFLINYPSLFDRLDEIRQYRNEITHSIIETSREKFHYDGNNSIIRFCAIESNPINNTPMKSASFVTIENDIETMKSVCLFLRNYLKEFYSFDDL
jgi:hypothetical protein